ncbi:MAG: phospholipid carrier-dependent glycosyltransferase [Elusimicrobia bacterium]|nr:phospholipid carrier-dependent glycosyltransferase [Elusimicrobiota bacterium]
MNLPRALAGAANTIPGRAPSRTRLGTGLAAGALLAFSLWSAGQAFSGFLGGCHALLVLVVLAAAAAGSGRRAVGLLGLGEACEAGQEEKTLAGVTLGLGFLSLGTLALAALGLLQAWAVSAMVGALLLWGYAELKEGLLSLDWRIEHPLAASAVGAIGLTLLWLCLMPPHQYDSLVYHLALPETYVREGRLVSPAHLLYSHFPQNAEMLFAAALAFKSDALAQMLMWLATALSLWWVVASARREVDAPSAWLAALFLATHTAVMLLATITYVEPLVMLWTTAAVLCMLRWNAAGSGRGWLALSAAFCGLALGTKYTAGATAALLALVPAGRVAFGRGRPGGWREPLRDTALFVAVTTAVFLPWLVKNALTIGNPVFPFLYALFPMTGTGWGAETARRYFTILAEYGHGESWLRDLVTLPYQLLVRFARYGGGMDVLGCLGWGVVFLGAPLALWPALKGLPADRSAGPGARRFLKLLIAYCACHFLAWFATGTVLRFLTALAPLLALLAAAGARRLWLASDRGARAALAAGLAVMTAANLGFFLYVHDVFETGQVLLGVETRSAFLTRRLDYYSCAAWCQDGLGPNDRILVVGEQRAYYLARDHVASTVNAPNRFVAMANGAADPSDLARRLRSEGFTAVLYVPREMKRLMTAFGDITEKGFGNISGLFDRSAPVFGGPACAVYRL